MLLKPFPSLNNSTAVPEEMPHGDVAQLCQEKAGLGTARWQQGQWDGGHGTEDGLRVGTGKQLVAQSKGENSKWLISSHPHKFCLSLAPFPVAKSRIQKTGEETLQRHSKLCSNIVSSSRKQAGSGARQRSAPGYL